MADARDALAETPLFERLGETALAALLEATTELACKPGDVIVREGDEGDALYVILDGAVQIFKQRDDGSDLVIARCEVGDYFGEQALLPGRTRTRNASVRAAEATRLCRIGKDAFQAVLAANHPLKDHLLEDSEDQLLANLALESSLFRTLEVVAPELEPELELAAGHVVFREGDASDALYLVVEGEIEIYRDDEILAVLGPGTSFGELGILENTDRSASARALVASRLVAIPASRFRAWQAQAPELARLFRALRRVYRLPNRGRLSQSTGTFLGREAVTNVYELGARTVVVSLVVGDDLYNGDVVGAEDAAVTTLLYTDPTRRVRRELRLSADRRLVGLTVHGTWPTLAELQRRLLEDVPIDAHALAHFPDTGQLALGDAAAGLVCQCVRVDKPTILAAIAAGATRLPLLQAKTGCGTVCGACVPAVRQLLGNEQWAPVQLVEDRVHPARDVLQLRLRTLDRERAIAPAHPGQHVIVSGYIDGEWVQRAYTLTSACNETAHYEITVKREPKGEFSTWLFDYAGEDTMLRVSPPRGEFWWRPTGRPCVWIVAGIGITPALACVRSALAEGWRLIHIDCSVRDLAQLAGRAELEAAAAAHPHITLHVRETRTRSRILQAEVEVLAGKFPDADFYLCGPDRFMQSVGSMLERRRIPRERIKQERFSAAAAAPVPLPPAPSPAVARTQTGRVAKVSRPAEPPRSLRGLVKSLFHRD